MIVCHLKNGDLFTCDIGAHRGRLYRFDRNTYRDGTREIEYSWAYEVAEIIDGEWTIKSPQLSNWNHCCDVKMAALIVAPEIKVDHMRKLAQTGDLNSDFARDTLDSIIRYR
jgi:hypothetical protein